VFSSEVIDMNANDTTDIEAIRAAERIYREWDEALGRKDIDAALKLYAPDAVLESPLVRHLLRSDEGIVRGRDNLRNFVEMVFARTPPLRRRHRKGFFTDGKRLIWEYPRVTPDGPQMDLMEAMDITDGLIARHCAYWGWLGVKVLEEDGYGPI
jgi:SnoaL-like domain